VHDHSKGWSSGEDRGTFKTEEYAQVLYKRATGELPEMECSKATAKILVNWVRDGDSILDVGCGVGHYLRSLKNRLNCSFSYTGVDNSPLYIELAEKAYPSSDRVNFHKGDIHQLPFPEKFFDIVMSNNVFLHLPSIEQPLRELCRVSRKYVLIRTLVGDRSFRIQEVPALDEEFNEDGSPKSFNYFNIYSKAYIEHLLSGMPDVNGWEIVPDNDFDPKLISANAEQSRLHNVTRIIGDWQVNGYILQPWVFIKVFL